MEIPANIVIILTPEILIGLQNLLIGMACATTTISCIECQELYDIVISNEPWLAMEPGFKVSQDLINCPVIRKHDCSIWKYPYPCPKCGSNMQRGPVVLLWD